jgi:hypothetical protein
MLRDVDAVKEIVRKEGFDGVLLFRVISASAMGCSMPWMWTVLYWRALSSWKR